MDVLNKIKQDRNLLDAIDWEMTPEEAVRLYLEWGNNWARGNYVIRSKKDETFYFAISTWKEPPVIYLIRRNSDGAEELAHIEMPKSIHLQFIKENGSLKGVYSIEGVVKEWLRKELAAA
ncbi:MAG: hypothetical protein M0036_11775 [Desulfobacteraceae bacterium]|nr:hypothetical protein [Desulfobacteraceae bacterium]